MAASKDSDVYTQIKWNGWGTKTRGMVIDEHDPLVVRDVHGKSIRGMIPFVHQEVSGKPGLPDRLEKSPSVSFEEAIQKLPQPIINNAFLSDMQTALQSSQVKLDGESRLTHFAGKNYRDLWRLRKGLIDRAPDAIILPQSHDDVVKIMEAANKHNVCVIPYGGGTNVTGGIEASPFEKTRMVVSVDMRRMTRLLSIDKDSRLARFEVGVLGPDLDEQLGRHGFMLGHDPDSYIYSTLGGWIASRSSGAMSNKYGDIESMVISLKLVTPGGVIETPTTPRPCGPDLNGLIIGSEGILGILTEAIVKIEKIPESKIYEGWLFPSFEDGFRAFSKCVSLGIHPTAMRLYDHDETRMGFAMKPDVSLVQQIIGKLGGQYLAHVKGYDFTKFALCITGSEGSAAETAFQRQQLRSVFYSFNAFCAGTGAGDNWQEKKYDLPYVRDFALSHKLWADVFETTTTYTEALPLWRAVKQAVHGVWKEEGKKGWIGCHTAHQYKVGCCLYFTYAAEQISDNDLVTFVKIKRAATEAMLKHKGNLTHHHGIGYEHVPWMERYLGAGALELLLQLKRAVDPKDICNPSKVLPAQKVAGESAQQTSERRQKLMMFDKMGLPKSISKL